ncbi:DUF397 domain-containing protein [Streptomyces glaucescens]|uniref:DUF397 domain-containing protein n=1 Tax=Streptomyces glaucescens TaxID=1907 RepID=UPI00344CD546
MIRNVTAGDGSQLTWFKSSYSSSSEGDSCVEVAFDWRKSSYSSGNDGESCVEVAVDWRKSSYSSGSEGDSCLEVATTPRTIHIRDSKHTGGPRLALAPEAWTDFLAYASRD